MSTRLKFCLLLLCVFALSGCGTIQLNEPPVSTLSPSAAPTDGDQPKGTHIPVTWGDLKLTGKLIYLSQQNTQDEIFLVIQLLNLTTGQIIPIYQAPNRAIVYALTLSPNRNQLILSMSVPNDQKKSYDPPALYILPIDGSAPPKMLFTAPSNEDQYYQPLWVSTGGKEYLYFSLARSLGPSKTGTQNLAVDLYRMALPDGEHKKIASSAFWPAVSTDGTRLVYVSIDPDDGTNQLIAAEPDGANARPIAISGEWVPQYIDAPLFLANDKTVLFSAVSVSPTKPAGLTWLDQLLGVTVASAHNIPSDWWSVSVDGGTATQLTQIQTTALFASLSPDTSQTLLASYSSGGLFVMNPDGTSLQYLTQDAGGIPSTLHWIP